MIINSGVHASLQSTCHHQIIYAPYFIHSCINQLLSINYEILDAFDTCLKIRGLLAYLYTRCVLLTKNNELNK